MKFNEEIIDLGNVLSTKIQSLKSTLSNDNYKLSSSNKKILFIGKGEKASNSSNLDIYKDNRHKIKEKVKEDLIPFENEEEEEINSDDYVSSTNLDVETDTYVNYTNNTKNSNEEKDMNKINNKKIINYPGRLRTKVINNYNSNNIFNENDIFDEFLNKQQKINKDKNHNLYNKKENDNINLNKFKDENIFMINSKNIENKINSNSKDKKYVSTPDDENKKSLKSIREMIFKKILPKTNIINYIRIIKK